MKDFEEKALPKAEAKLIENKIENVQAQLIPLTKVAMPVIEEPASVPIWPDYILTGRQLLEQGISEPDYLWEPFLQRQGLAVLGG